MLHDDELNLIGIIPESDLSGTTNETELKRIIYDALSIGPMFQPLIDDLRNKGNIDDRSGEVFLQDVCKALYSNSFLKACPMVSILIIDFILDFFLIFIFLFQFVSRRETIANIKLISSALIITRRNLLSIEQIHHGLNAYVLECRETKQDYLYMIDDKVKRTLRLINMACSDAFLNAWINYVITNLEWNNKEREVIRQSVKNEYEYYLNNRVD